MNDELVLLFIESPEDLVEAVFNKCNLRGQQFVQFFAALAQQSQVVRAGATRVHHHFRQVRNVLLHVLGCSVRTKLTHLGNVEQ